MATPDCTAIDIERKELIRKMNEIGNIVEGFMYYHPNATTMELKARLKVIETIARLK